MTRLVSHLCGRSGRCSFQAQLIGNRLLDNGTLEEARVVTRVQHCGIGERELAKILFRDEALLDHLKHFGYDIRKVGDVSRLLSLVAFSIIASLPSGQTTGEIKSARLGEKSLGSP
jgi:hypothetical protein